MTSPTTKHQCMWRAVLDGDGKRLPPPGEWVCDDCGARRAGCLLCGSMLRPGELATCRRCVRRTDALLAEIVQLYEELPDAIKTISGIDYDRTGPASAHDVILPGGDALAILAGGTSGMVTADRRGNRHPEDQLEGDPPSAAAVVSDIEDGWRRARGDAAAPYAQSVSMPVAYLRDHNAWAADFYPGYVDDVAALRQLRSRMSVTAGRADIPEPERTPCVYCGGEVVRFWKDAVGDDLGGLSEVRQCTGCDIAWGDRESFAMVNRDHLRAMRRTHPDALVTEEQARSIFAELSESTIRVWIHRDRERHARSLTAIASWPKRRAAALERRREAEEAGDRKRAARIKIPSRPVVYERQLPERGKDVLGQTLYRVADIAALAEPTDSEEERAS